mgnify:CR=1 FL=1
MLAFFCILMPTISDASNYTTDEIIIEKLLVDPANNLEIQDAAVSISSKKVEVDIVYNPSSLEASGATYREILGIYTVIVEKYPEVGDLEIIAMTDNSPTKIRLICEKDWVLLTDTNDVDSMNRLWTKVLFTMSEA